MITGWGLGSRLNCLLQFLQTSFVVRRTVAIGSLHITVKSWNLRKRSLSEVRIPEWRYVKLCVSAEKIATSWSCSFCCSGCSSYTYLFTTDAKLRVLKKISPIVVNTYCSFDIRVKLSSKFAIVIHSACVMIAKRYRPRPRAVWAYSALLRIYLLKGMHTIL